MPMTLAFSSPLAEGKPQSPVRVGVYYFPGWSPGVMSAYPDPWAPIRRFPERLPRAGEYNDRSAKVMRRQLNEMRRAGLSFVVFDTYTTSDGSPRADQSLKAYTEVVRQSDVEFALLWANHDKSLNSIAFWDVMVKSWLDRYLSSSKYVRVDSKPLVFIFSAKSLDLQAATFGSSAKYLLERAQKQALSAGLKGIAFVAGGGPQPSLIRGGAKDEGYVALSDYNMGTGGYSMSGKGYARRVAVYRNYWRVYARDSNLPVILPMTVGWDRAPWGGSREDGALSNASEFAAHVREGVTILQRSNSEAGRMGVICCWNEYGEGSVLEPTKQYGDTHLRALKPILNSK
jgi:hypothetical protein